MRVYAETLRFNRGVFTTGKVYRSVIPVCAPKSIHMHVRERTSTASVRDLCII